MRERKYGGGEREREERVNPREDLMQGKSAVPFDDVPLVVLTYVLCIYSHAR